MNEPDQRGFLHPTGELLGGHEYLVLGCDVEHQQVTILNSWGRRVGAARSGTPLLDGHGATAGEPGRCESAHRLTSQESKGGHP